MTHGRETLLKLYDEFVEKERVGEEEQNEKETMKTQTKWTFFTSFGNLIKTVILQKDFEILMI